MKTVMKIGALLQAARKTLEYEVENAILELTEQICERMASLKISRKALADRLDTSPGYVTKLLSGKGNLTIESMVKVADALDAEVHLHLVAKEDPTVWVPLVKKPEAMTREFCAWSRSQMTRDDFEAQPREAELSRLEFPEVLPCNEAVALTA